MHPAITSLQNPKIKRVLKLNKRGYRDRERLTVVEGSREIDQALAAGVVPAEVYLCTPLLDDASRSAAQACRQLASAKQTELYEVSEGVYAKIAYRERAGGILAVVPSLVGTLDEVGPLSKPALVMVVEGAEKPGNFGAVLRSADAAGVDLVIACGEGTDANNPNVIRASLGAVFALPVVQAETEDAIEWLAAHQFRIISASPDADISFTDVDLTGDVALVVGSEAFGLTDRWLRAAHVCVTIPMYGKVDSLNLSASSAVLLYEAVRQRRHTDDTQSR